MKNTNFDFGKNWKNFSKKSLSQKKFKIAEKSLEELIGIPNIKDKSFLDIGSGSGIFSLAAKNIGAKKVIGFDISKNSVEAAYLNKERFAKNEDINFFQQSILEKGYEKWGTFDIVYSWGVLHHTGKMWQSIINSMKFVKKDGLFVIALYNRHWSSPLWVSIKWFYNISPKFIQWMMVKIFYWIIALAKFLVTGKNPFKKKKRGMDFYHDVVDWIGGYPYEYASKKEVVSFFKKHGFELIKFIQPQVPTGCNEFIFKKI